jgi:peptide/nickel transport system ATP-binding protein
MLNVENLEVWAVSNRSPAHLIGGVSFTMARGEVLGLVGPSGCGKSMTALAVLNLLPSGVYMHAQQLALDGVALTDFSEAQWRRVRGRKIALIFQQPRPAFDPLMRVGSFLQNAWARHHDEPKNKRRYRLHTSLERVGLAPSREIARLYPHEMSGGVLQRAMIALALGCEPQLLIADEPTSSLDLVTQAEILTLLRDLQREKNFALLLITHDFSVLEFLAHRVLVMDAGKVVEAGPVQQLLASQESEVARRLVAAAHLPLGI